MCIALPWQVAALWRLDVIRRFTSAAKMRLVAAQGAAGVGLVYTLQKPDSAPWFPFTHWFDCGCTGTRAMDERGAKFGWKITIG
jgi:hypothetical protein